LGQAAQALADDRRAVLTVDLPTGNRVRMYCRPVPGRNGSVGGVLHVKLVENDELHSAATRPILPMFLPGLVGSAPLWLRSCHDVNAGYGVGEWLALAGGRGVGKLALARGVHQRRNPTGRLHVLDAAEATDPDWLAEARRELVDDPPGSLVIRHVDRLTGKQAGALTAILQEAHDLGESGTPWVTIT